MLNQFTQFQQIAFILIGVINVISLLLFFIDKKRAQNRKFRIPEKTLLLSAFLFGGIGAWIGMSTFRHKTKHTIFKMGVPIAAIITLAGIYFILTY